MTERELLVDLTSVSPASGGGIGRVATGVVTGLLDEGVPLRCLADPSSSEAWRSALPEARIIQVAVRMSATSGWQTRLRALLPASLRRSRLVGAIRRIRSGAVRSEAGEDVVWYPFHRSLATASTSVVTVHDLRVFEPDLASAMDQRIIERNVAHAAAIVCSWPHPYESVLERFPDARDKTFQIPLPVLNADEPKQDRRSPGTAVKLFYPAYVTEHKDHETIIRGLAELPDARLILTGAETSYARTMRSLAAELGVADRIEWRGYVDQDQLDATYREADVLVMPSLWEAASGPVLEAVIRRIPFVCSDIPPLAAQLRQLNLSIPDWTFAPRDPRAFARSVRATVDTYGARAEALAGPAIEVGSRTWASTAADYHRVFAWAAGEADLPSDLQPRPKGALR